MNCFMPPTAPQQVLASMIHELMQCREDFSIRVPDTALTSRCVKAVYMEKPSKYFILVGQSDMPVNGLLMSQAPVITGGDRYDCVNNNYPCVEKIASFLCGDSVE